MNLGLLAVGIFSAEPADDIKPPSGYRQWFHVNTMVVERRAQGSACSQHDSSVLLGNDGRTRSRPEEYNSTRATARPTRY
jgi:hypothetical protein